MTNEPAVGIIAACSNEGVPAAAKSKLRCVLPCRRPCSAVTLSWCLSHISNLREPGGVVKGCRARQSGPPHRSAPSLFFLHSTFQPPETDSNAWLTMSDSTLTRSLVPCIAKMVAVASKSTLRKYVLQKSQICVVIV